MPKFLFNTLDSAAKSKFTKWRKMVNQGETMDKNDLVNLNRVNKDTETPLKNDEKNKSKKTCHVTKIRRVGIQDTTVDIKLASSDEDYIVTLAISDSNNRLLLVEIMVTYQ